MKMGFALSNSRTCLKHLCTWVVKPLYFRPVSPQQNSVRCGLYPHTRFYATKGDPQSHRRFTKEKVFTPRKKPAFPDSVFSAGASRKRAEYVKQWSRLDPEDEMAVGGRETVNVVLPDYPLTPSEWSKLKEDFTKPEFFEKVMMLRLLKADADINIAKSLLSYMAQDKGVVSYEVLLKYLTLCVKGGHHSEVFDTYEIMKTCFKTLDLGALSLFIKGFSQTDRWREAILMLQGMNKALLPSPRNYGDVITAAARHGDSETSWKLYDELLELGLVPNQETWQYQFESSISQRGHEDKLYDILSYMRDDQIYPEKPLIESIKAWFESLPDQKWSGRFSFVTPSGDCKTCKTSLESIQLTEEEYSQLKDDVMKKVIEAGDVFNKTNPEELKRFMNFVRQRPPFDIVVDGLNVAKILPHAPQSETLLAVVSELEQQSLNILVLGRKHMQQHSRNWDRQNLNKIRQKAHCFFTENISEDDPFLLYAALNSGSHCKFLSRDLMRDHKACLPDSATRRLFFKWQRGHQLVISQYTPGKRVHFESMLSYDTIIQTDGSSWHIPYDENAEDRAAFEVPQKWLCLTRDH